MVLGRVDRVRVLRVVGLQDMLELGEAKLVVLLFLSFHCGPALGRDALLLPGCVYGCGCLDLGVEAFVRDGVPARVTVLVDEALRV